MRSAPHFLLLCLIIANLLVAVFIFDDYGESWDESNIYLYAAATEQAYTKGLIGESLTEDDLGPFNLRLYGPFSFVVNDIFARAGVWLAPQVNFVDFWHLSYFLFFLIAVACVYALCMRYVGGQAALAATLIFNLQPLLWGHAWMNPKDISFMALFLLSIVLGLRAADKMPERDQHFWSALVRAALALGAATAVRVIAPLAGIIVGLELFIRGGKRSLKPLLIYLAIAATVTYLLWPFLWGAPIRNFVSVLEEMRDFPLDIAVLFNGVTYSSTDLPTDYFPRLLALQLTGPAILLILAGLALAAIKLIRGSLPQWRSLLIALAWFLVPASVIVLLRPTMYDNFRQFLFLLPPLFVFAAIAFQELTPRTKPVIFWLLALAAVIPGILAMVGSHPYEYVYYNRLAGDDSAKAARYENDYWVTSYRDAVEYLNDVAPLNSVIFVYGEGGPGEVIAHFGRTDLKLLPQRLFDASHPSSVDYAILTTRGGAATSLFVDSPVIFEVNRNGATFAVVKEIN